MVGAGAEEEGLAAVAAEDAGEGGAGWTMARLQR